MSEKVPKPGELEKELNDYLSKKYGDRVRLSVPFLVPEHAGAQKSDSAEKKKKTAASIDFSMKPEDLEAYLDEYVVKQDDAKEILATKICTHFNRINYDKTARSIDNVKNNILMIGPTGVGKTYLIKLIAQKLGVPFVKGDATKFSETGYVGGDVEDLVRDLVKEADGDIERAQYGIIYVDEIDKIAGSKNILGADVSRTGVQRALLKPMEETEVDLKVAHDPVSQMEALEHYRKTGKRERRVLNTRNILFIVSGAFTELEEIIERRVNKQGLGFGAAMKQKNKGGELFKQVKAEDLVSYGFESEFIGRLPVIASFEQLTTDDLYEILKSPNSSVINSKKKDFMSYGIDIRFEDAALHRLAEMAADEKTGARGLISVVEKVLLKFEKALPSTDIRYLVVTPDMVDDPGAAFEKILGSDDLSRMYELHRRRVEEEKKQLETKLLSLKDGVDESRAFFLASDFIAAIVTATVEKYFDYRHVLERAGEILSDIHIFERAFSQDEDIEISFDSSAVNKIIERALMEETEVLPLLEDMFKNYKHGLKLIKDRTGRSVFTVSGEAIESPQGFLNSLITESYR